jgi:hypothetical protein
MPRVTLPPLLVCLLLLAAPARAADPHAARYSLDGSQVLWFLQLTDTHIDTVASSHEEERLGWALTAGVDFIQPDFVVVTGDLTDSTAGLFYGLGPIEEEWQSYRNIVNESGMLDPDFYFDLAGNHDAYGDGDLTFWTNFSLQGTSGSGTQFGWRLDRPFGSFCFYTVATPGNDGAQWPFDNQELTEAELAGFSDWLLGNPECRAHLVFGHHDYVDAKNQGTFRALAQQAGVGHYIHGHQHDLELTLEDDGIERVRTDSLGQGNDHNLTVFALDHDAFAFTSVAVDEPWPLIVITAPAADPRSETPVPAACEVAPVRALVFDDQLVPQVRFRWDQGPWADMTQRLDNPRQWRGLFAASGLGPGTHRLQVQATGSGERTVEQEVRFVEGPCDLGTLDPDLSFPEPGPEVVEVVEVVEPVSEVAAEPLVEAAAEPSEEVLAELVTEAVSEAVPETATEAVPEAVPDTGTQAVSEAVVPEVLDILSESYTGAEQAGDQGIPLGAHEGAEPVPEDEGALSGGCSVGSFRRR